MKFVGDGKANTSCPVCAATPKDGVTSFHDVARAWASNFTQYTQVYIRLLKFFAMIAVARSGLMVESLSLVVWTFHVAKFSCLLHFREGTFLSESIALSISYGLRKFSTTAIGCGASDTSNAVALSESL